MENKYKGPKLAENPQREKSVKFLIEQLDFSKLLDGSPAQMVNLSFEMGHLWS